jgi:hypothetical protein
MKIMLFVAAIALTACSSQSKPAARPEPAAQPAPAPGPPDDSDTPVSNSDSPGGQVDTHWGDVKTGIATCDEYVGTMQRYADCDKLPPEAKQAMIDAFGQSVKGWAALADAPPEAQKAASESCQVANDAAKQALDQLGCA